VDDFTAQAKADALAKKKKRRNELIAIFLLLMLDAGEEAYLMSYPKLAALQTPPNQPTEPSQPTPTQPIILPTSGKWSNQQPTPEELKTEAEEFAQERQENLSQFPARVIDRFEEIITESQAEKASEKEIRSRLNKAAEAVKKGQGRIVSETESQAVAGGSQLRILKRAGFETAFWQNVGDERVRDGHIENEAAGETKLGDEYPDGCRYPGDPKAPIECTIGCRCWLIGGNRK